jgi:hypothetical protein
MNMDMICYTMKICMAKGMGHVTYTYDIRADICPSQNVSTVCMYDHAYVYYPSLSSQGCHTLRYGNNYQRWLICAGKGVATISIKRGASTCVLPQGSICKCG